MTDFSTTPNPADTPKTTGEPANPADTGSQDQGFLEYNGRTLSKEEALKKLANADAFIETLKSEREQDRKQQAEILELLKKATNAEGVLSQLKPKDDTPAKPEGAATTALDEEAIVTKAAERLAKQMEDKQKAEKEDANWKDVTSKLASLYGTKVNERVAEVAKEHGMSLEDAAALARSRPSVFMAMFKAPAPKPSFTGTRNTAALKTQPTGEVGSLFKATKVSDQVAAYQAKLQKYLNQ